MIIGEYLNVIAARRPAMVSMVLSRAEIVALVGEIDWLRTLDAIWHMRMKVVEGKID